MSRIITEDLEAIVTRIADWEKFSGQTVLVTGAGGFLGNYLALTLLHLNESGLLARPVQVIAGIRRAGRLRPALAARTDDPNLHLLELDLARIAMPSLPSVDYVIHAASHASPRFYGEDPVGTLLPNTVGTAALLEAAGKSLKGFLFVSSSEIYGLAAAGGAVVESSPGTLDSAAPRSCYAEGKRAGEALCVAWGIQHGVPIHIARPFHTYGPGLAEDDGRVFADFIYNAVKGEDIHIRGDGSAVRAFCYASDAVAGLFTILLRGAPGQAYNLGNSGGNLSVRDLAQLIATLVPEQELVVREAGGSHRPGYLPSAVNSLLPDTRKLAALGWRAEVTPEEGFRRTLEAHR